MYVAPNLFRSEWKSILFFSLTWWSLGKQRLHRDGQQFYQYQPIKVITKLPNSEQSYKGKVKPHKNIKIQNQSTTGKL